MAPLPPLRDGGCALPICPFGRACHPLISDAPDCKCSPGRLRFWVVWASCPGAAAPISIHAPRVGRDARLSSTPCASRISIHAPRVGRDLPMPSLSNSAVKFQSTRPVWGATGGATSQCEMSELFQSTRPVWGATRQRSTAGAVLEIISIHAPRVGRDEDTSYNRQQAEEFQSTRPVWGATMSLYASTCGMEISIHAPRVGRDRLQARHRCSSDPISIHAPRVGRDLSK